MMAVSSSLVARFCAGSAERLERVEAAWRGLVGGSADATTEEAISRDVHTLKGDARVVGFGDVATLCERLEDVLAVARGRRP
jgi:chemotaxis protein histidine kinase CheA